MTDADIAAPRTNQLPRLAREAANKRAAANRRQVRGPPVSVLPNLTLAESMEQLETLVEPFRPPKWLEPPAPAAASVAELLTDPVVPVRRLFDTEDAGVFSLPHAIFREPLRLDLLNRYVKWQRANWRPPSRPAKTRSDKRGSGRKIRPQKGTGQARMGNNRSPSRKGSGKAHGPTLRDWAQSMNRQERRLAMRVVLSQKLREGRLHVIEEMAAPQIRTKEVAIALKAKGWDDCLLVHADDADRNDEFYLSMRNIPRIDLTNQIGVTVYKTLKREHIVLTRRAVSELSERVAKWPARPWKSVSEVLNGHRLVSLPTSSTPNPFGQSTSKARGAVADEDDDVDDDDDDDDAEEEDDVDSEEEEDDASEEGEDEEENATPSSSTAPSEVPRR